MSYLVFPGNLLQTTAPREEIYNNYNTLPHGLPPLIYPVHDDVIRAAHLPRSAERPLIIVGKGAAYAKAENILGHFFENTKFFILTYTDEKRRSFRYSCTMARTSALQKADVILLLGARLNWILRFGRPPRYNKDVKFMQDAVIASEGANTIDIERAVLLNESGNFILDWEFVNEKTYNWADVNRDLLMIPGVIETGLFVNMATKAYLSMSDGQVRTRERDASI
ncbi:hypothetical protein GQX74_013618 [Glossina fuscipes]|nr:hypothetical protein GQX74_013618 [Glossina fuscipes]